MAPKGEKGYLSSIDLSYSLLFIRWGTSQVQFFLQWTNLIGPSLKKKNEIMKAPQNRRFYFEI